MVVDGWSGVSGAHGVTLGRAPAPGTRLSWEEVADLRRMLAGQLSFVDIGGERYIDDEKGRRPTRLSLTRQRRRATLSVGLEFACYAPVETLAGLSVLLDALEERRA